LRKKDAVHSNAIYDGSAKYEVTWKSNTFVVNLSSRTCGCKIWQLSRIPCKHAIEAICLKADKIEDYIHNFYLKTTYMASYEHMIHPIPGMSCWQVISNEKCQPTPWHAMPGTPKNTRQKGLDEQANVYRREGSQVLQLPQMGTQ